MRKQVLFICGSLNQTTMMHKISEHLPDFECHFTPFYADGLLGLLSRKGKLDFTILGGSHRKQTDAYLRDQGLSVDFGGQQRDYVLVATSPLRETFRRDDREAFIRKADRIAGKRQIIFKLHPIENEARARAEINKLVPRALVYAQGNAEHMTANCEVLITQTSSLTFAGMALGKEVHTDLDLDTLKPLLPIQNGGASAGKIAKICRRITRIPLEELRSSQKPFLRRQDWQRSDIV